MSRTLSELVGERLRGALPVSSRGAEYAMLRQRLVEAARARRAQRTRNRLVVALAAPLLAAVLLVIAARGSLRPGETELVFQVGDSGQVGQAGRYYAAQGGSRLPIRFADGSGVSLEGEGGLRVSAAEPTRVALLLETGSAEFDVVPSAGRDWEITAGPYLVRVTGTAFRLSWNVFARSLEVEMRRGSVVVTGPGLEPGQRVSGTERFVTRVTSAVTSGGPVASSAAVPARTPDEAGGAAPLQPRSAPSVDGRAITPTAPAPPTRAAAAAASAEMPRTDAGAAPERTASAPAASARSAADATSAQELLALADEARFARRPEAAREALLGVRRRYPGSAAASEAAFLLGRLADDAGDLRTAVTWYDRHAREAGSLTPEALGRKMLALHRLGDLGARDRAARDYLARFPDGPYARQARELTAR